jgi:hypothetical protein
MFANESAQQVELAGTSTASSPGEPDLPEGIDTLGHTSGWDCVAGVLTASECWLAAHHSANRSKQAPRHDARASFGSLHR